jgi:hypothetical protein
LTMASPLLPIASPSSSAVPGAVANSAPSCLVSVSLTKVTIKRSLLPSRSALIPAMTSPFHAVLSSLNRRNGDSVGAAAQRLDDLMEKLQFAHMRCMGLPLELPERRGIEDRLRALSVRHKLQSLAGRPSTLKELKQTLGDLHSLAQVLHGGRLMMIFLLCGYSGLGEN